MRYLLQIYPAGGGEGFERLPAQEQQAIREEYLAIGQLPGVVGGERLQPADTATTVRVADGETLITDGPFVDAKEQLGVYASSRPTIWMRRSRSRRGYPPPGWAARSRCVRSRRGRTLLAPVFRDEWGRVSPTSSASSATSTSRTRVLRTRSRRRRAVAA